jgi:hypothetical protein
MAKASISGPVRRSAETPACSGRERRIHGETTIAHLAKIVNSGCESGPLAGPDGSRRLGNALARGSQSPTLSSLPRCVHDRNSSGPAFAPPPSAFHLLEKLLSSPRRDEQAGYGDRGSTHSDSQIPVARSAIRPRPAVNNWRGRAPREHQIHTNWNPGRLAAWRGTCDLDTQSKRDLAFPPCAGACAVGVSLFVPADG